jgi:polar amino acid transport system permease protein/cystine transport system permease protein
MSFSFDVLLAAMPRLSWAALINLQLAAAIILLAVALGTGLTVLRSFKLPPVNIAIDLVISFVRGTPLLIQIFICYYGLPAIGLNLSPFLAGILAIGCNSAIFLSEAMRASLGTIDPGQVEAATALGLPPRGIWQRIVLPQMFRRLMPVLTSELTIVIKGTALLSVITVVEVLRTAQQIASATYRPFENLVAAALIFLVLNLAVSIAGRAMESRLAQGRS